MWACCADSWDASREYGTAPLSVAQCVLEPSLLLLDCCCSLQYREKTALDQHIQHVMMFSICCLQHVVAATCTPRPLTPVVSGGVAVFLAEQPAVCSLTLCLTAVLRWCSSGCPATV